ncbi:hypothetical protein DH2020_043732 [Rehmannia glutinosa]|uniref:Glucan endo-1,3-beta-D-glucosidase n=1 Tax=Rehmannia glutinosa TaxID=99300 RepID=A0ABR0UJI8_REHGL
MGRKVKRSTDRTSHHPGTERRKNKTEKMFGGEEDRFDCLDRDCDFNEEGRMPPIVAQDVTSTKPMKCVEDCATSLFFTATFSLGINYGQIANNLPHPEAVVPLVKSIGATRVKLYDADPRVLKAFANTGVEFIVGLGNEYLSRMRDPKQAQAWVKTNVQSYLPATKITCIAVGNEHPHCPSFSQPRQASYGDHRPQFGHSGRFVSSSAGAFRRDLNQKLSCILDFHSKVGSPFLINAYPYFAYKSNPKQVSLDFVLFESGSVSVDQVSGLHYDNMFHAQIDAAYSAIEKLGYKNVCLQISETGWPSKGDADEAGATPENARKYNGNLIKMIADKKGTPMRPNLDLNIYVFALFNENQKPGPTSERNFGLFKPDGTPVYNLGFNTTGLLSTNTTGSVGSSGGTTQSGSPPAGTGTSSDGYLSITADDACTSFPADPKSNPTIKNKADSANGTILHKF